MAIKGATGYPIASSPNPFIHFVNRIWNGGALQFEKDPEGDDSVLEQRREWAIAILTWRKGRSGGGLLRKYLCCGWGWIPNS